MNQKILLVTGRIDTLGGTEIYLQRVLAGLAAREIESWCLSGGAQRPEPYRHITDPRLHDAHLLHANRALIELVESLLSRERFDAVYVANIKCPEILEILAPHPRSICHVHDHRYLCPTGVRVLPRSGKICDRRAGLACFAHCALTTWLDHRVIPRWTVEYSGFKRARRHAHRFARLLVASRHMREALSKGGFDSRKIGVLPCLIASRDPTPCPIPTGPFRAVFVGRVEPTKGADVFVRAISMLRDVSGIIVGDGAVLEDVRRLALELGVSSRIELTGGLPNDQALARMRSSHVVVVPSCWPEPFGMVGIEAMGVGRAVIGSNVGGIPDWLADGETGLLVPPADAHALANAIGRLMSDPDEIARMGQRAWQAAESFLPDAHIDRFLELAGLAANRSSDVAVRN